MEFTKFEARLNLWQHLKFSAIEIHPRSDKFELYATANNHQTLSQLFICCVNSAEDAGVLRKQFQSWLLKCNISRHRRTAAKITRNVSVNVPGQPTITLR
ncbi:hypothetical protein LU196_11655 [Pantoea sp. Mb-10]|uniref:hypothetical protein n=1 Tax=unclassified Pantoea TaxID=2630326 RepID=UPI001E2A97AF|nr:MULTISPECIES: hypothetical protein [unclassified Pantoea]MCE0490702.1 hypothetical protein [Pantoea sp. Mb-10]MCE0500140.1 hypothetical protein [Pantoea sp. Pb-8]